MMIVTVLIAVALILGIMLMTVIIPSRPDALKIVGGLVCRGDEKIEILTSVASYHAPGEKSIEIYCSDYGKRRDVKGRILLLSFVFSSLAMLPVAGLIVFLIYSFIN